MLDKYLAIIPKKIRLKRNHTVKLPLGFGKNYFCLAAIQAYISMVKIIALASSVCTLDGKPLKLKINSPPAN
jgi:hypothetical protein